MTLLLLAGWIHAQSSINMYNFNSLPQSLRHNPAYPQQGKGWFSLPGVGVSYLNSGFNAADLLSDRESEIGDVNDDNKYDVNDNLADIINNLDGNSTLSTTINIDIIGVGFKANKGLVSFGANQQTDYYMNYPVDLLKLLNFGNGQFLGDKFSLSEFDFESTTRINTYLGYQRSFMNERLYVGFRVKYMFGQAHAYVERMNLEIEQPDRWEMTLRTNALVKTAGVTAFGNDDFDPVNFTFSGNNGIGLDLGAYYKVTDKLNVSASVLDIGSIDWEENTRNYVSEGEYTYDGIDVDFSDEDADPWQQTQDSLESELNFREEDGQSYRRSLITRFNAGVNYELTESHGVGLMYQGRAWDGQLFSTYAVNYTGRWSRFFQFTASYAIVDGIPNNIGAGIQLKLGPLQIYAMSDNIFGALQYDQTQYTNVTAGVNFTFFGPRDKEKEEDKVEKLKKRDKEERKQEEQQEEDSEKDN